MAEKLQFTTPVGRLVGGSLYQANDKDYQGNPLTMKDKVTPRVEYSFGVAFPKTPGCQHWANEPGLQGLQAGKPWLAEIWQYGNQVHPGVAQRPDFSWKIIDGDSTIPNKRNKRPCDNEGYPGHWVIWFSGGFAPQIWNADGTQQILEPNAVKRGYYVQVCGNADKNTGQTPGLYMNYSMVAFSAYGQEIQSGPDVSQAGFGGAALPAGASTAPMAAAFNPATPAPALPQVNGGYPAPTPPAAPVPPAPAAAPVIPVMPNPAVLAPPGAPVPPAPVPQIPVMPAAPVRQMTALAQGATYEQLIAGGWNDALLIQQGLMLA